MYEYSHPGVLPNLRAEGCDNILTFKTPSEIATVTISSDNRIKHILHQDIVENKEKR